MKRGVRQVGCHNATVTIRMIATDLDGTFFGPDHSPAPRTSAALNSAKAAGVICVAISGRGHGIGADLATSTGAQFDYFIGSNGGHRLNFATGEMEEQLLFSPAEAAQAHARFQAADEELEFGFEADDIRHWHPDFVALHPTHLEGPARQPSDRADTPPAHTSKIFITHPRFQNKELAAHVEPHIDPSHNLAASGIGFLELTPAGADKGSAIGRLCALLDIDASEVLAFGDNYNDLSLLEFAGHSVAMANAVDETRAVADEITLSNAEFGVATVLERLFDMS